MRTLSPIRPGCWGAQKFAGGGGLGEGGNRRAPIPNLSSFGRFPWGLIDWPPTRSAKVNIGG